MKRRFLLILRFGISIIPIEYLRNNIDLAYPTFASCNLYKHFVHNFLKGTLPTLIGFGTAQNPFSRSLYGKEQQLEWSALPGCCGIETFAL